MKIPCSREPVMQDSFDASSDGLLISPKSASIMELPRLGYISNINPLALTAGFLTAFFTGLIALKILLVIIQKTRLPFFGYYCLIMASLAFFTL